MPDQVEIRITALVITAQYGTLSSGTILRTNAAFARHLIEDCRAAEYLDQARPTDEIAVAKADIAKPKKPRVRKAKAATQPE